jgi:dipeptidyl aminopeptidase/acylaminoacyl peptidase
VPPQERDRPEDGLSIEAIVAIDPPREYRLHPRDRSVAYTAEVAGSRQLFTLPLRGGYPTQLTASAQPVSDPQWSPDGRRLAFVRDNEIWVIEADGSRVARVTGHMSETNTPRWSPDGKQIAFISRRRGWSQVWVIDAPVPRRGRPANEPRAPEARALTGAGEDVLSVDWSTDGSRVAVTVQRRHDDRETAQIVVIDVSDGTERVVAGETSFDTSPSWCPDGSLLYVSDADGWFQVVRLTPDGRDRIVLTSGERERGFPNLVPGSDYGFIPDASPDGTRFVHVEMHDGLVDLVARTLDEGSPPKRGRGRPPKTPRTLSSSTSGQRLNPWDGVWRHVSWLSDGAWVAAIGENETRPQDLWLLPVPSVAPDDARPRQVTNSMPAVVATALAPGRMPEAERFAFAARDGLRIEGTLWRPARATGKRGGDRVPTVVRPHGGPTTQAFRNFQPFRFQFVREGFAYLEVDYRGSTGYGRAFRVAIHGEWGHGDVHDVIDSARWAAEQPWSDGRLAVYGGSYGGYLVLSALVEEPSLWRAGVDLFGDSEIAESYRHGDRVGRLDLDRMMGSPDDPARAKLYRRGSPVYRAERIEAPLLLLHGRKDKRVVPLMTERMVEALEIEGKYHEVHWFDDEGHGFQARANLRDAFRRILTFLRTHVIDEPAG